MEEIDLRSYVFKENLFELFKQQLKKDFESCAVDGDFADQLQSDFEPMAAGILKELQRVVKKDSVLTALLYRIDINEATVRKYQKTHPTLGFDELLTELIIKRILQKVILKKHFSS